MVNIGTFSTAVEAAVAVAKGVAVEVVERMLKSKDIDIGSGEIGVIAAFRSQVLKLRKRLRERGLNTISVGQVHDFQGQEMKAIVISNVLARPHPHAGARTGSTGVLAADGTGASAVGSSSVYSELGFLASPKRFNVAVTRAKVNL